MNLAASLRSASQSRRLLSPLLKSWYRLTVLGADLVPARGAVVLVANHIGFLDAAVLAVACPRPVRTLASDELFAPPLDRLTAAAGHIALRRSGPDFAAISQAAEVLDSDEVVALFPEGSRGRGSVASVKGEAAYLALTKDAVVVPVAILGTRRTGMDADALPRRNARIAVVFDEPFRLTSDGDVYRRCVVAAAGETMRQRLADHARGAQETTGLRLPDDDPSGHTRILEDT